jgi:hypothetical protein
MKTSSLKPTAHSVHEAWLTVIPKLKPVTWPLPDKRIFETCYILKTDYQSAINRKNSTTLMNLKIIILP